MRKCDICSTPIPLGTDRCPSCGYRYKPERKLNQQVRAQKKAEYMSQFQPHPSPLDDLRRAAQKRKVQTISDQEKGRKIIKRVIIGIITIGLLFTVIPIGIGVFLGIREVLSEESYYEDESWYGDDSFDYEWYTSYEELEDANANLAWEIDQYRDYVLEEAELYNDSGYDYSLYESYNVYGNEIDYAYISIVLEVDDEYVNAAATKYSSGEDWAMVYSMSDYLDDGVFSIDNNILNALATVGGYDVYELTKCANSFALDFNGNDMSAKYHIEEGVFSIDYYDDYVDVALTLPMK